MMNQLFEEGSVISAREEAKSSEENELVQSKPDEREIPSDTTPGQDFSSIGDLDYSARVSPA